MSQTDFTLENVDNCSKAAEEMFDAIPKTKRFGYLGHLNDILLFLGGCKKVIDSGKDNK